MSLRRAKPARLARQRGPAKSETKSVREQMNATGSRFRFADAEPGLDALLSEPLTQLIMRADSVDHQELKIVLNAAAKKLRSKTEPESPRGDINARRIDPAKYRPGVGIILLNARNHIFVGHRNDVTGDAWQLPQGGVDRGETPRQAALRELREEIGTDRVEIVAESKDWLYYDLPAAIAKNAWAGRWKGQRQKWFVMRLAGPESEIDIATAHPEFDRWRWIHLQRLPAVAVSFKRQLYLSLVAEFGEIVDTELDGSNAG